MVIDPQNDRTFSPVPLSVCLHGSLDKLSPRQHSGASTAGSELSGWQVQREGLMYIYHVDNETKRGYRFPTPELAIACPPPFFFSLSASLSPLSSTYLISHRFTLLPPSFNKIVPFRLFAPYLCPFISFPPPPLTALQ